jgi:hypothetical protein
MKLTKEQIEYMVGRFLCWRLPKTFNPDAGISYDRSYAERWGGPSGTNLFDAAQAEEMILYMISGMPDTKRPVLTDTAPQRRIPYARP